MSTNKSNIEVLSQDWVQKFHFENKVDLNLQMPSENESTKIEINDIPIDLLPKLDFSSSASSSLIAVTTTATNATNSKNNDSYLQSILSSSPVATVADNNSSCTGSQTCTCYKCQRQRRRAGIGRTTNTTDTKTLIPAVTTDTKTLLPETTDTKTMSPAATTDTKTLSPPLSPSQQQEKKKRSNTIRKTPTQRSYEKHMPKPTYSQQDSIYRIEEAKKDKDKSSSRCSSILLENQDNYEMAWKEDETGDDLLTSLVTFQTIFEEKGNENEGLSDLLEKRAQELKYEKLKQQQEASRPKITQSDLPPRRLDCLTLSYRNGLRHNPLTLYHTMKMNGEFERMGAYNTAFKHCINANSGLRLWIKKSRVAPTRESSKLIQSARRPATTSVKKSLLFPLTGSAVGLSSSTISSTSSSSSSSGSGSKKKNKVATGGGDDLWSTSSDDLSNDSKRSIDMIPLAHTAAGGGVNNNNSTGISSNSNNSTGISNSSSGINSNSTAAAQLTDVLSAAQALLPNQNLSLQQQQTQQKVNNRIPYQHIDTPSRPRHHHTPPPSSQSTIDFKDTSSISSSESVSGTSKLLKSRPGRLFSSLGRKTSMISYSGSTISNKASSIRSLEKIEDDDGNEELTSHEKVLDDLCRILPHIDRAQLSPYVDEANNDYMAALQLCKAAVISGKLS